MFSDRIAIGLPALALVILMSLCAATPALAEPPLRVEPSRSIEALRKSPHTISNATAWVSDAGQAHVALGLDQGFRPVGDISLGLGSLAEFGLRLQRERSRCVECGADKRDLTLGTAFFKIGLPEGTGHAHVPAIALVFRKALPTSTQAFTNTGKIISKQEVATPIAILTAMVSKELGPVGVHLGAELLAAQEGDSVLDALETPTIRPALGLQYRPPAYPLTTLLADLRWIPSTDGESQWGTAWNAAWGVRYQAFTWAAVDLNLRHQEHEGIGDAIVTLGLRGAFDLSEVAR